MNLQKFFEYDQKSEYTLTVSIRGWQPSLSKLLLQCIFEWGILDVITLHIQVRNVNVLKLPPNPSGWWCESPKSKWDRKDILQVTLGQRKKSTG